jgi:hypothetical protein
MHKQQIQRPRSQDAADQGIQSSRNPTTTLTAATSGKSTKLIFHVFCISSFTQYAVTDYARHTRIDSRIENYSSRNHRKKPSSIILCQPRPPQSSVHNTSQATLQTQIPSRTKPQSRSRNQKISYKNISTWSRLDKQYTIHSTQPIYINPNAANNISHRKTKPQNHSNYALATLRTPETCQKIGKTKLQQPIQPIHVSQIVRIQHPGATKNLIPQADQAPERGSHGHPKTPHTQTTKFWSTKTILAMCAEARRPLTRSQNIGANNTNAMVGNSGSKSLLVSH